MSVTADGHGKDLDLASGHSTSNILTLEPYSSGLGLQFSGLRKKSRKSFSRKGNKCSREVVPGVYETVPYNKYLTIKLSDDEANVFKVYRDIVDCCGRKPKISPEKR